MTSVLVPVLVDVALTSVTVCTMMVSTSLSVVRVITPILSGALWKIASKAKWLIPPAVSLSMIRMADSMNCALVSATPALRDIMTRYLRIGHHRRGTLDEGDFTVIDKDVSKASK